MITNEIKQKVLVAMKIRRANFSSDAKFAASLGVSSSQYSRIVNGEIERVISESNWLSLSRKLDVIIGNKVEISTAQTETYKFITSQLKNCQESSLCGLLCDKTDIGKTHTAMDYAKRNKNVVYVDCSQVKTKQRLVKFIAKELGVTHTGKYYDVYEDLIYYLKSIENPLIILDEAGDLKYEAFLELKALWNATENCCAWYMMGANALEHKIDGNMERNKVGYAELFRRFGKKYQHISPKGKDDNTEFDKKQIAQVAIANGIDRSEVSKLYAKTGGSLSRLIIEIQKLKKQA